MAFNVLTKTTSSKGGRIWRNCLCACFSVFVSVSLAAISFEVAYRYQIIDFYHPELTSYNRSVDINRDTKGEKTCLIIGDSFSAGSAEIYPAGLREALPDFRIINSSVAGIGSIEANLMASNRFSRFDPDVFIYQIYVGNDLFDIRHPSDYGATNLIRWTYWNIANHLRSVEFLNYRLGQSPTLHTLIRKLRGHAAPISTADLTAPFSEDLVGHREKMIYSADPKLLDETIGLKGRRQNDFLQLLDNVHDLLDLCIAEKCRALVLVIPHKVQVAKEYADQYEILGATYTDKNRMMTADYPFVQELETSLSSRDNVLVINPLGTIQDLERRGQRLYYTNDEHMNSEGQALLARLLVQAIRHHESATVPFASM